MRLHRPPHDFGRICRRVLILLGCAGLHAIQHLHLHARADARSRFRFWYQRRRDLFNNRVLLLHHPPMTSAAFAAAFLSFSGALLLNNMSASVFAGMQCRKGQVSRPAQAENPPKSMMAAWTRPGDADRSCSSVPSLLGERARPWLGEPWTETDS